MFKNKYTVSFLVVLVLFISACARVEYVGRSYNPTFQVDLYFSKDDIKKDYEVMGRAISHGPDLDMEELQEALIKEARERGADGIIISDIERIFREPKKRDPEKLAIFESNPDKTKLTAEFIKYTENQ